MSDTIIINVNLTTNPITVNWQTARDAYQIAVADGYVGTRPQWLSSLKGEQGDVGADGQDGQDGTNGRELELGNSGTAIRWRLVGDAAWTMLVALSDLKGDKGDPGTNGTNGTDGQGFHWWGAWDSMTTYAEYDIVLGSDGNTYVAVLPNLNDDPVAESGNWTIFTRKGDPGTNGTDGTDGTNGTDGINGTNGTDGAPGPNLVSTVTETNITGLLKGNGATVLQAVAGTDYVIPAGNVATATALQNARTINGVSFNGTANITITAAGSTLSDIVPGSLGGTGVANTGKTVTLGASLTTTGTTAPTLAFPSGAAMTYTFPTASATLATLAGNTFSGVQLFTDGTQLLPGIAFSGSTNMGFWRETSQQMRAVVGGVGVCIFFNDGTNAKWGFATSPMVRSVSTGEVYQSMQGFPGAIWGVRLGDAATYAYIRAAASPTANVLQIENSSGTAQAGFTKDFALFLAKTITAAGTTGAQTISKPSGSVNFAAGATSLVVTNTLVTANSVIQCTVGTNDTTMFSARAVAAAGSFTIYPNAAPTAETRVNFTLTN